MSKGCFHLRVNCGQDLFFHVPLEESVVVCYTKKKLETEEKTNQGLK